MNLLNIVFAVNFHFVHCVRQMQNKKETRSLGVELRNREIMQVFSPCNSDRRSQSRCCWSLLWDITSAISGTYAGFL